jgi:hypothetical protein
MLPALQLLQEMQLPVAPVALTMLSVAEFPSVVAKQPSIELIFDIS